MVAYSIQGHCWLFAPLVSMTFYKTSAVDQNSKLSIRVKTMQPIVRLKEQPTSSFQQGSVSFLQRPEHRCGSLQDHSSHIPERAWAFCDRREALFRTSASACSLPFMSCSLLKFSFSLWSCMRASVSWRSTLAAWMRMLATVAAKSSWNVRSSSVDSARCKTGHQAHLTK